MFPWEIDFFHCSKDDVVVRCLLAVVFLWPEWLMVLLFAHSSAHTRGNKKTSTYTSSISCSDCICILLCRWMRISTASRISVWRLEFSATELPRYCLPVFIVSPPFLIESASALADTWADRLAFKVLANSMPLNRRELTLFKAKPRQKFPVPG